MDLFHTVTQSIESVLTCHWLGDFKAFKMPAQDKTMDTEPGGETTQCVEEKHLIVYIADGVGGRYESIKTQTVPAAKQSGQLGSMCSSLYSLSHSPAHVSAAGPNTVEGAPGQSDDRGSKIAENIRYGQNISESGMGGMTTTSAGQANQEGGYGGTERNPKQEEQGNSRTAQGYGSGSGVGA
jgi:hypothetical protein